MDYFAVGGQSLLSSRLYPSIFNRSRLHELEAAGQVTQAQARWVESYSVPEVAVPAPPMPPPAAESYKVPEVAVPAPPMPPPAATEVTPEDVHMEALDAATAAARAERAEAAEQQPSAPTSLHKAFHASEVGVWEPCRFAHLRKLQDAARNRGQVHLMRDTVHDRLVAVKQMPTRWVRHSHTDFVIEHPSETELPWQDVGCIRFLNSVGYAYGCSLLGVYRDEQCTYVVSTFATEGDLFAWCEAGSSPGLAREAEVRPLARQLLQGVQQLHDYSIVHRDLSLENVLLTRSEDGEGLELRIIDFSMASTSRRFKHCVRGKASYQAPEVHTDAECDAYLSDAFAVGVTLYALLLKDYPWLSTRPGGCKCFEYVRKHGFRPYLSRRKLRNSTARVGEVMSEPLIHLLEGLLAVNPDDRLTLGERGWGGARRSVWDEAWLRETGFEGA